VRVSELTGRSLDYWVAKAEGYETEPFKNGFRLRRDGEVVGFIGEKYTVTLWNYSPSTDWSQGGPIIEREKITLYGDRDQAGWAAVMGEDFGQPDYSSSKYKRADGEGDTALIAAMRCYVASKFGEEVADE
jgi:hypothetical protein